MLKLIGDNPFQGVSHLSAERAVSRGNDLNNPRYCADLILKSGADGFMFTLNEKTLDILKRVAIIKEIDLYPLVPDVSSFVKNGNGTMGIAKYLVGDMLLTSSFGGIAKGITGVITQKPALMFQSYLEYELSRISYIAGGKVKALFLHEVLTDMALALGMDWILWSHWEFCDKKGIKCGFETRNFTSLMNKLLDHLLYSVVVAAPFNSIGFQMCPSKQANEKSLLENPKSFNIDVIAFSILAAGFVKLDDAIPYIKSLPIDGVCVGVSSEAQAKEAFNKLKDGGL